MAWVSVALIGAGTAANVAGGVISRNDALNNATAQANARNASLSKNLDILNGYGAENRTTFNNNLDSNWSPTAQATGLSDAQTTRGDANVANITKETGADAPISADASPASRSDLAKRMLSVYDGATARAKAIGKLGGYSDAWTNSQIADAQAARDIGVVNTYANDRKSLIEPEAQNAATAAYKSPSIWGTLLSGAGSIASSAGGSKLGSSSKTGTSLWDGNNTFLSSQPTDI